MLSIRKVLAVVLALSAPVAAEASILAGLDVLERRGFAPLVGKRVGLITNHTGRNAAGRSAIDVLFQAQGVKLVALFSPEHGIRGDRRDGDRIPDSIDPATGLPIYSLYGATRRPTPKMLEGLDVLVFDIQDVGARFYTYLTTMAYGMEEAAKRKIAFVVLDRPNPISGNVLEGPVPGGPPDFTGYFPVPIRHGLTPGEMARLHADLKRLDLDLTVVPLDGWRRPMYYDETGYAWTNPSPNIRGVEAALMYPAIGSFEGTNMSVGRGTASPFLWFGAPWLDAARLVARLSAAGLAGARFHVDERVPAENLHGGKRSPGVRIEITDRARIRPMEIFIAAVCALRDMNAPFSTAEAGAGARSVYRTILDSTKSPAEISADFAASRAAYEASRAKYLLY